MAIAARLATRRPYYGWYIVGVLFLTSFLVSSLNIFGPGIFLKPMTQELHWSRGFFSTVVWMSTIISAPVAMVLWPFVDKRGGRGVMLASGLVLGIGTIALGLVQTRWQFAAIKSIVIPLGTMGLGPMMGMIVVSNWFVKKRGRVLALSAMGMSTGGIAAPLLFTYLISALGWRQAWMVAGLGALVLSVLPVALFIKRRPEDLGLLPDGEPRDLKIEGGEKPPLASEARWTRREVLRTPTFWLMAIAQPLGQIGFGIISQHFIPYMTDPEIGFTPGVAAIVLMSISTASLVTKLPWGFVMERVPPRYCYVLAFSSFAAGMGLSAVAGDSLPVWFLAAALLGTGQGASVPLQGMIWAVYYGRPSQGMARSLATPIGSISGPLGPILAGFAWDITGTYSSILAFYVIPPVVASFLIVFARPPRKPGLAVMR